MLVKCLTKYQMSGGEKGKYLAYIGKGLYSMYKDKLLSAIKIMILC